MSAKLTQSSRKLLPTVQRHAVLRRRQPPTQSHLRLALLALVFIAVLSVPGPSAGGAAGPAQGASLASVPAANTSVGNAAPNPRSAPAGNPNEVCYISASLGEFIGLLLLFGVCLAALAFGMRLVLRGSGSDSMGRALCL